MLVTINLTQEQVLELANAAKEISVEAFGSDIALRLITEEGEKEELAAAVAYYTKLVDANGNGYSREDQEFAREKNSYGTGGWLRDFQLETRVKGQYLTLRRHILNEISAAMRRDLNKELKKYEEEFRDAIIKEFQSQSKSIMANFMAASFTHLFQHSQYQVSDAIRKGLLETNNG